MNVALRLSGLAARMRRDLQGTLERVAAAGFEDVVLNGSLEGSADSGREELERAGLNAVAANFNLHDLHSRLPDVVRISRELGVEWIVLDHLDLDEYGDGWYLVGRRIVRWLDAAQEAGFKLAYHNHRMEFLPDQGASGLQRLMEGAGEGLWIDYDVAWSRKAGQDPVSWLHRLTGRVGLIEFDRSCLSESEQCRDLVAAAGVSKAKYAVIAPDARATDPIAEAERQRRNLAAQGVEVSTSLSGP